MQSLFFVLKWKYLGYQVTLLHLYMHIYNIYVYYIFIYVYIYNSVYYFVLLICVFLDWGVILFFPLDEWMSFDVRNATN